MRLAEIAEIAGAEVSGDADFSVGGIASLEHAQADELSFVRSSKWREAARESGAGALLVSKDFLEELGEEWGELDRPMLVAANSDAALVRIGMYVTALVVPQPEPGVHPTALLGEDVEMGSEVAVGANVVLEDGVSLGDGASIGAGCYLGKDVAIGAGTTLAPNVTVLWGCRIGARCRVHSGTVIGSDGFGFLQLPDGSYRKLPQLGNAVIEDDVEIGACVTIDRATLDSTVLKKGVKLDNLVHIAHNVTVGENTVMAAQVGVAGSSTIGRNCAFGGQAGVGSHLKIGPGTRVGGQAGIAKSYAEGGIELWATPAREKAKAMRDFAALEKGEATRSELRKLRARVEKLERELKKKPAGGD
jgi:UDP-3-O-[3-hydroxymyristoyl] glucosamine N-acyltransferase